MKNKLFIGSGVAIVTPFTNDKIDFDLLGKLIDFQINNNTQAIIVCGTTGESSTLSNEEKKELINYTVQKANNRIPVIAGTGGNNTKSVIELSQYAQSVGVNGLLIVTPYYNKTTQKGLVEHYSTIAQNVNIPIILYNVPSRTGLNISIDTYQELSKIENIVATKEASGNISQIAQIAHLCKDNLYIYSGNDDQIVPILSLGGIGVISVLANVIPNETNNICKEFFNGNIIEAKNIQLKYLDLIDRLFIEVNPIPVKQALINMGYDVGKCRLPLCSLSDTNILKLRECMEKYNLI